MSRVLVKQKGKREVRPRFELGLLESEPNVITTYTIGPLLQCGDEVTYMNVAQEHNKVGLA